MQTARSLTNAKYTREISQRILRVQAGSTHSRLQVIYLRLQACKYMRHAYRLESHRAPFTGEPRPI